MFKPETLKAGLKVSIFFLLGFVLLGEPLTLSLFLAALGGIAGGFLFAGWKSTELPSLPSSPVESSNREEKIITAKDSQKQKWQQLRRQPRNSWFFWKNSRSSKRRR